MLPASTVSLLCYIISLFSVLLVNSQIQIFLCPSPVLNSQWVSSAPGIEPKLPRCLRQAHLLFAVRTSDACSVFGVCWRTFQSSQRPLLTLVLVDASFFDVYGMGIGSNTCYDKTRQSSWSNFSGSRNLCTSWSQVTSSVQPFIWHRTHWIDLRSAKPHCWVLNEVQLIL